MLSAGNKSPSLLARLVMVGLALGLTAGCGSKPNRTRDAAVVTGAALVTAGVYRATTGGCWAQCTPGRYCNRKSGLCEELPRGAPPRAAAAAPVPEQNWWEAGEAACPEGSTLNKDPSEEGDPVILCSRADGTPHGRATFFYSSGRREMEGEYRDGKAVGAWQHWDEDGKPGKLEQLGGK